MDRLGGGESPGARSTAGGTTPLQVVVFDLDGTLADTERDGHRVAFNRAFEAMHLPDRWDEDLYGELLWITGGRDRIAHYFTEYRPLPKDERERLATMLHGLKNRLFLEMVLSRRIPPRPGVRPLVEDLLGQGIGVAIATGGSREWVEPLLERLFGSRTASRFDCIICGDDIERGKPDPEIYRLALERLGGAAGGVLAVEDAENGLRAAKAAGIACVVVPNDYTRDHDFSLADLVVAEFGDERHEARVVHNPHGVEVPGRLTPQVLREIQRRALALAA